MKGRIEINDISIPLSIIMARAQLVRVIVLPERCIVAQRGITKSAISPLTPFFFVCSSVTGIVAAEDCVPRAVKYAGIMFLSRAKGFFFANTPAITYWKISMQMCRSMIIPNTLMNTLIISNTVPENVRFEKIPNTWKGRRGIIMLAITFVTMSWNSLKIFFIPSAFVTAIPRPRVNERMRALITSIIAGISMVKSPATIVSSAF